MSARCSTEATVPLEIAARWDDVIDLRKEYHDLSMNDWRPFELVKAGRSPTEYGEHAVREDVLVVGGVDLGVSHGPEAL
jgi:hypothetical protein